VTGLACLALILPGLALAQRPAETRVPEVEPSALTRDANLVGREVTVDDRVRFFQSHRGPKGQVFDELVLKRTDVVFKLPPSLRPERSPRQPVARVTGVLRMEGRQVLCDVTSLEMLPPDLERLDREVKRLATGDSTGRTAWATWAERRGRDFKDAELIARARSVEIEALLIEADRPNADDLGLARRAKGRDLGDDLANALAHRGFRARLDAARSADDYARLAADVATTLPRSTDPRAVAGLADWAARAKISPIATYRSAPEDVRAGLDRALLAEVLKLGLERRLADAPGDAMALADEANAKLPDRPEVAQRLRERGLATSEGNAATMRLSEAEALAKTFRDDGQPDRARAILRSWLAERRRRLNPSDADGQVLLAEQYDRLVGDRTSAANLLRDALKAEPESKPAADAFRRMGYRKTAEGRWYDPAEARADEPAAPASAPGRGAGSASSESLRGMTMEQVRSRLGGKPDRVVRSATQDATIEQWIYQGPRGTQVVNFRRTRGKAQPEVVANYALP